MPTFQVHAAESWGDGGSCTDARSDQALAGSMRACHRLTARAAPEQQVGAHKTSLGWDG